MVKQVEITPADTESRIMDAAKTVFIEKGLDGTTMQQIADKAGMNKSLLHYYFRTKEKLFKAVFSFAFNHFVPQIQEIIASEETIFIKIERIVDEYIDMLSKNSFVPAFILHEINRNPDRLFDIVQGSGLNPKTLIDQFMQEIEKGNIRPVNPKHLIVNMLSLCIFPFAARPLLQRVLFNNESKAYLQFLHERKKIVTDFIIHSIRVK